MHVGGDYARDGSYRFRRCGNRNRKRPSTSSFVRTVGHIPTREMRSGVRSGWYEHPFYRRPCERETGERIFWQERGFFRSTVQHQPQTTRSWKWNYVLVTMDIRMLFFVIQHAHHQACFYKWMKGTLILICGQNTLMWRIYCTFLLPFLPLLVILRLILVSARLEGPFIIFSLIEK